MKQVGNLKYDPNAIARLCRENDIAYLALFGSYLHGDNNKDSDIDLLVEFSKRKSLMDLVGIEHSFNNIFGKKVDLVTKKFLSKYFRDKVLKSAQTLYEQKN